jgi:geranylgeranyl diphosphate synthase type II
MSSHPLPIDAQSSGKREIEKAIGEFLPAIESALKQACRFGPGCPETLADAIRYALLSPGKRLRPALVLMAAEACGGTLDKAMPGAVAVEMIHAYSLIHDDLPAMDDDDLRRGRPTVHVEFDEATAILAGDALQPLAFRHLSEHVGDPQHAAEAVRVLARAAGPEFLVGGQADDLAAESGRLPQGLAEMLPPECSGTSETTEPISAEIRNGTQPPEARLSGNQPAVEFLEAIHRRKTGALFAASLDLGAVLSGASPEDRKILANYAADIGLAFQVVDDLLDHTADEQAMGKRVNKDAERGKLTYPTLLGLSGARQRAAELVESARQHLAPLGSAAWKLDLLAVYVLERSH